jgi:histidinol-phosphate aminotransferase
MIKSKSLVATINRPGPDTLNREELMRLDKNERTTLFTDSEFNDLMSTIRPFDLVAYSELEPTYQSFVKWLEIERDNLLLTFGSDAAIKTIFETFVGEGDEVINFEPNYAMFSVYAKLFGAKELVKLYNEDFTINIDSLINAISEKTKMVIISNPGHNGLETSKESIIRVIERAEKCNTLVVIDEAYYHFSYVTLIDRINKNKNIIIVRTLSKAFGLASLRVGYLVACSELVAEMYRVKLVHEIDGISAKISRYMVENIMIMENYLKAIEKGHEYLKARFRDMDITFMPSNANFIYFRINREIDPFFVIEELKKKRIYIRTPIKTKPFDSYLRITIGDMEQMKIFCNVLQDIFDQHY